MLLVLVVFFWRKFGLLSFLELLIKFVVRKVWFGFLVKWNVIFDLNIVLVLLILLIGL